MKFAYTAFDRSGKGVAGVLDAASAADAGEILRRDGMYVTSLSEAAADAAPGPAVRRGRRRRVRGRHRTIACFMRQLAVLVSTGTPMVEALEALERQEPNEAFRAAVADVRRRVEEGASLSAAMEADPAWFDAVCRSLAAAGESSGQIDVMLNRLAELTRQQLKIRTAFIGAMIYPTLLTVVAMSVLTTMMIFVMPRFAGLFKTLNAPLPPTTRVLMHISDFLKGYWFLWLPAAIMGVSSFMYWSRTPGGRAWIHAAMLRAPKMGSIVRSFATARMARLIGVLLESKVQLLEALDLTRQASTNVHYARLLERARESVTRGEPLSTALSAGGIVTPSVCEAVRNGERTGQVGRVLLSMADFLDEENEIIVRTLTSLLEPVILILMGIVVGFVATSMFLPLFDLTSMTGPGGGGEAP